VVVSAELTAIATLLAAIGALVTAGVGALVARSNNQRAVEAAKSAEAAKIAAQQSQREIIATKEGVFELGKQVDGRLSELLTATRKSARAEGVAAGEQAQRDRAAGPQP
jgi:hypothetical protein